MVYQCEALKKGEGECGKCTHFMWGADCCIEDSLLTPIYRAYFNPDHKPPEFEKREGADDPPIVITIKT